MSLSDEEREHLYVAPENPMQSEVDAVMAQMTEVMSSEAFGTFIDASAKVAVRFYKALIDEGAPLDVAAGMAAAYCQNLSQQKAG